MGGPGGGHGPAEKAKDVKGTTKKLAQRLSRYKIAIIIVMIFAIGSTIFSIVGPKILGNATTEIYTGLFFVFLASSALNVLSVLKSNADQIIVLEDGKVVGKGTHEELIKTNETYKQIALSQLSEEELNIKDLNNKTNVEGGEKHE